MTDTTRRCEAKRFWSTYDIPFEWDTAIKGRLSGLSRGSTGTGHASDTVVHLHVEEAFSEGRLSRDDGTYLCSPNESPRFEFTEERHVEDGEKYIPKVTCSTCLERMKRWKRIPTGNDHEKTQMSDEEFEVTFDPMFELADRWDITLEDAEVFLESVGYFQTQRVLESTEYFDPTANP